MIHFVVVVTARNDIKYGKELRYGDKKYLDLHKISQFTMFVIKDMKPKKKQDCKQKQNYITTYLKLYC